jgi:hypothetical protein
MNSSCTLFRIFPFTTTFLTDTTLIENSSSFFSAIVA